MGTPAQRAELRRMWTILSTWKWALSPGTLLGLSRETSGGRRRINEKLLGVRSWYLLA